MTVKKKQDSLLRDAIADAKAVRDTALANARAYLEESFTPHLTSMLAAKLRNEVDEDASGDDDAEEVNEAASLKDSEASDGYGAGDGGETDKEAISETTELVSSNVGKGDNAEPGNFKSADDDDDKETERPMGEGVGSEVEDKPMGDVDGGSMEVKQESLADGEHRKDDIDMEIESILDELDNDEDVYGDEDNDDYDMEAPFGHEGGQGAGEESIDDLDSDDEMQGTDVAEAGTEDDIADLPGSAAAMGAAEHEDGDIPAHPGAPVHDDEIDLDELMREIASTDTEAKDTEAEDGHEKIRSENVNLKTTLAEYRKAVKLLRSRLVEVNLLNAKLLYTNKLFKNFNLDVGQKMRVIETFDRAATLREAKLVYATLTESFHTPVSGKNKTVKTITEGMASKAVGGTKPKSDPKVLSEKVGDGENSDIIGESVSLPARWKKLAGITN